MTSPQISEPTEGAPIVVSQVPGEAPNFFRFNPVATAQYMQYGVLIPKPRVSFVPYVAAGGPFRNF